MRSSEQIVAVALSDIHLWSKAPIARSSEEDWYAAMARPLQEVKELAISNGAIVICAGDIFDHWKATPELINFAYDKLPLMYSIPGQHDLPLHSYSDIKKSAYWTLVMSGKIINIGDEPKDMDRMRLYGFPWGRELYRCPDHRHSLVTNIAVVHTYVWKKGHCYPGAPKDKRVGRLRQKLQGYDVCIFGDNHSGFLFENILNCGTLIRRKMDERSYKPHVGLIMEDGSIKLHYLNCEEDKFVNLPRMVQTLERAVDVQGFLDEFNTLLSAETFDFSDALIRYMKENNVSDDVKEVILSAMEEQL